MAYLSEASPLETYNSLSDRHLVHFFRSARIRKHLIKSGLVTKDGEIRPESEYREIRSRENQKRALLEIIAHAIVERSLEEERMRQGKIRRTLEEICKLHKVRRMREERQKRSEQSILLQLVPRTPKAQEKLDPITSSSSDHSMDKHSQMEVAKMRQVYRKQQLKDRKSGKAPYLYLHEPGVNPGQLKDCGRSRTQQGRVSLAKSRGDAHIAKECTDQVIDNSYEGDHPASGLKSRHPAHEDRGDRIMVDEQASPCVVRFMYLGASRLEEATITKPKEPGAKSVRTQTTDWEQKPKRLITVLQQPSGAGAVTVFKGLLQAGDVFEFTSRRSFGHPFSLSLCIDGTQHARISACCEYRHKCGMRIGGKYGHFVYLNVEGSMPCFKCQAAQRVRKEEKLRKKKKSTELTTESGGYEFEELQPSDDAISDYNSSSRSKSPSPHSQQSAKMKFIHSTNETDCSCKGT